MCQPNEPKERANHHVHTFKQIEQPVHQMLQVFKKQKEHRYFSLTANVNIYKEPLLYLPLDSFPNLNSQKIGNLHSRTHLLGQIIHQCLCNNIMYILKNSWLLHSTTNNSKRKRYNHTFMFIESFTMNFCSIRATSSKYLRRRPSTIFSTAI